MYSMASNLKDLIDKLIVHHVPIVTLMFHFRTTYNIYVNEVAITLVDTTVSLNNIHFASHTTFNKVAIMQIGRQYSKSQCFVAREVR